MVGVPCKRPTKIALRCGAPFDETACARCCAKRLAILIGEDPCQHRALYVATLNNLKCSGCSGATVTRGTADSPGHHGGDGSDRAGGASARRFAAGEAALIVGAAGPIAPSPAALRRLARFHRTRRSGMTPRRLPWPS